MTVKQVTHWRTPDPSDPDGEREEVDSAEAEELWAVEARTVLTDVAGTYHGLITHTDLAAAVQEAAGVHTGGHANHWIGRVLAKVAAVNLEQGEPPLISLVVHKLHGTVGEDYDAVLRLTGADPITDPVAREKHAAASRMECYRWADAVMPADGGHASLSPRYGMVLSRERKKAREAEMPSICPTCFMAIPPIGECDNCA